jgi:hypothetical protein
MVPKLACRSTPSRSGMTLAGDEGPNRVEQLVMTRMPSEADELTWDLLSATRAENDHPVSGEQVHPKQVLGGRAHDNGLAVEAHVQDHDRCLRRERTYVCDHRYT